MVCRNFILPETCKPCLFLSAFQFAKLILPDLNKSVHLLVLSSLLGYRHFFAGKTKSAHRSDSDRWALRYVQLFLHDFQHHSGPQLEAVLKDQAIGNGLKLVHAIRVLLKQFLLLIRHDGVRVGRN